MVSALSDGHNEGWGNGRGGSGAVGEWGVWAGGIVWLQPFSEKRNYSVTSGGEKRTEEENSISAISSLGLLERTHAYTHSHWKGLL